MKTRLTILFAALLFVAACSNSNTDKAMVPSISVSTDNKEQTYPYVTAKINGKPWQSVKDEILATYSEFDDKLQIFTKDADGKYNFLLTLAPFSKTTVSAYNSVREGAGGYGISLLDENTKDDIALDYDNFHQEAVAGCLHVISIKETAEGKIVEGTFASPMNVSNNYDTNKDKGVVVTDGKFAVLVKK